MKIRILSIHNFGLLDITSTGKVTYNKKAIMKHSFKIGSLKDSWALAKATMSYINKIEDNRAEYYVTYMEAYDVMGDLDLEYDTIEDIAIKDAMYDFCNDIATNIVEESYDYDELIKEIEADLFASEQQRRLNKLLNKK